MNTQEETYSQLHYKIVELIKAYSPEYTLVEGEYWVEKIVDEVKRFDKENEQQVVEKDEKYK